MSRPLMEMTFPGGDRFHRAAAVAVGGVDPAVESPFETVEPMLLVARRESGEQHLPHVGPTVAIRVLGVKHVRRRGDERPLAPRHHAGGERRCFQETVAFSYRPSPSVSSRTFTTPPGLPVPIQAQRIVAHLHHPEPSIGAPLERDRIHHQRLRGHQLDAKSRPHAETGEGFGRRLRWRHVERDQFLRRAPLDRGGPAVACRSRDDQAAPSRRATSAPTTEGGSLASPVRSPARTNCDQPRVQPRSGRTSFVQRWIA